MTKNSAGRLIENNLLNYLDTEIEKFRINNGIYPDFIEMNKETKDKLLAELELEKEPEENGSWQNHKFFNYKGIPVKIKKDVFLELIGE
jgi:hypothetical protein